MTQVLQSVLSAFAAAHNSVQVRAGYTEHWGCRLGIGVKGRVGYQGRPRGQHTGGEQRSRSQSHTSPRGVS